MGALGSIFLAIARPEGYWNPEKCPLEGMQYTSFLPFDHFALTIRGVAIPEIKGTETPDSYAE